MGIYFSIFESLIWQGLFIYYAYIMARFFNRVFKYKAKIISDRWPIILLYILCPIILVQEFIFLARIFGILSWNDFGITVIPILFLSIIFPSQIFAYNDEIFIFSNKVCKINDFKVEEKKVNSSKRIIITTNQKLYPNKLKLCLNEKNYRILNDLLK